MAESICYLDGVFKPLGEAQVSVLDRGFIFGDGVYEVVPVFDRVAFCPQRHHRRLTRSLAAVGIPACVSAQEFDTILSRLIEDNEGGNFALYLQITRGVGTRQHAPPADMVPTVFAMVSSTEAADDESSAISAVTREDFRWGRCDIKSTSLVANVLLRGEAQRDGAEEAILIRDGAVTEGAASNVFVVAGGVVKTPPHSEHILPGVTRDLLVELLARSDIVIMETGISRHDLHAADEIWLTSSSREMSAVGRLDAEPIGNGKPGPVFAAARRLYQAYKTDWVTNRYRDLLR